eukprot:64613_1
MSYIAAVDAGTSSVRVILYDKTGKEIISKQRKLTMITPQKGYAEQDPFEIIDKIYECMYEILSSTNITISDIICVGITNQRETTIVWDKTTGLPLYNAIVWIDNRSTKQCNDILSKHTKDGNINFLKSICGLPLHNYFSATKLKWLYENIENVSIKSNEKKLKFGNVNTWIIWNLLYPHKHLTDVTNASRTMLMNINTLKWDKNLYQKIFNFPKHILPQIVPCSHFYGYINDKKRNCPFNGIPLCSSIGDQQSSMLGQLCTNKGDCKNTYGSAATVMYNLGTNVIESNNGLLTTVLYQFDDGKPAIYGLEGTISVAGLAIKFIKENLNLIKTERDIDILAAKCDDDNHGMDGLYFIPAFNGLFAPYWTTNAKALIYGFTLNTKTEHICKAVLESVCYRVWELIECIKKDTNNNINILNVDGGMSQSDILLKIQSNILQIPIKRSLLIESTAFGAAIAAGLCKKVNVWNDLKDAKRSFSANNLNDDKQRIVYPNMTKKAADKKKQGWNDAIKRCFTSYSKL